MVLIPFDFGALWLPLSPFSAILAQSEIGPESGNNEIEIARHKVNGEQKM